jgi:hypothetical protein
MKILAHWIILAATLAVALPAQAGTSIYTTKKSGCAPLTAHTPAPDVEARAGFDHRGNAVKSPDLYPPPMDVEALKTPNIGLNLPITKYIDPAPYNADLTGNTDIQLGTLKPGPMGELTLDGKLISTGQQEIYPKECGE